MFSNCYSLVSLKLNLNPNGITNLANTFKNCNSLIFSEVFIK